MGIFHKKIFEVEHILAAACIISVFFFLMRLYSVSIKCFLNFHFCIFLCVLSMGHWWPVVLTENVQSGSALLDIGIRYLGLEIFLLLTKSIYLNSFTFCLLKKIWFPPFAFKRQCFSKIWNWPICSFSCFLKEVFD